VPGRGAPESNAGIPKLGWVRMRENLRLCGVILGATVSFEGGRWYISVQIDTDGERESAPAGTVAGIDLGVTTLATISTDRGAPQDGGKGIS
jgi:putative transposase